MRTTLISILLLVASAAFVQADEVELLDLGNGIQGNAYFSPYENLDLKILEVLSRADAGSTVYQSYYSLSYTPYYGKYKELASRGVDVKVNLWDGSFNDSVESRMKKAGVDNAWIMNIRRPPPEAWSSMHTKITVVNDEWVISGSANLSNSASLANHEHIIILKSKDLARELIKEFNEQRAASEVMNEYPDINGNTDLEYREMMARLNKGPDRIDQPTENTNDTVQTYFSPEDRCEDRVKERMRAAKVSIKVAMYTFFSSIASVMRQRAEDGVQVVVLLDAHQHEGAKYAETTLEYFRNHPNINVVFAHTSASDKQLGNYASLHHKYAIIDDEVVIGGSYNWTRTATDFNDENMMVVHSSALADRFNTDFATMLQRYEPELLQELRHKGVLPEAVDDEETTRVLFAVSYSGTDESGNNAWDYNAKEQVVVVGNIPELGNGDPAKGLVLRGSRSVSPRLLGSVTLPRDSEIEYRVVIRTKKQNGGFTSVVLADTTNANAQNKVEAGARFLEVDTTGTPMIVGPFRPANLKDSGTVDWGQPKLN